MAIMMAAGLVSCGEPTQAPQLMENTGAPASAETAEASQPIDVIEAPNSQALDFSLPVENDSQSLGDDDFLYKTLLPDFFSKPKEKKKAVIQGKLLNDPLNPDYIDSIEGAEISVEIETQ